MSKKKDKRQKSHSQFIDELFHNNECFSNKQFEVLGIYDGANKKITVKDKYGYYSMTPYRLLKGRCPGVDSAIDKKEYCKNVLSEKGIELELIDVENLRSTKFKTKYGECSLPFHRLLEYVKPNISSALNKTGFMKKEFFEVHGNKYDYSKSIFSSARIKVEITCRTHGEFFQNYSSHKAGSGCPKCGEIKRKSNTKNNGGWKPSDWDKLATKSKNFDSFKFYIIRCWDEHEEFYKVGVTFNTLRGRFPNKASMPYNYEIIQERVADEALRIHCLEKSFKRYNKKRKYKPKKEFNGKEECYSEIIDIHTGEKIR